MSASQSPSPQTLADLQVGQSGRVESLAMEDRDARRLMELGFLPGAIVQLSRRSPFGDPSVYRIDDADVALRRKTAQQIVLGESPREAS